MKTVSRVNVGACGVLRVCGATALYACMTISSAFAQTPGLDASRQQFRTSCGVCHTANKGEPHRQGPNLNGVFGRAAGSLADFKYSAKLKAGGWSWDEKTLDAWLENSQEAYPGTMMPYRQANPEKRAAIILFLKSLTESQ
jgi:cytochrome c